ncbi:MAG: sensor histidine kinase [Planctomycetota bacterium]|jgi:PAS domain S-box-containing protein
MLEQDSSIREHLNVSPKRNQQTLESQAKARIQAEEDLRLQSEIMKNVSDGVYLVGADDGIIKFANPKFEQMFGYDPVGMIGKEVSIVNAPTERTPEETRDQIASILAKTGEWHGEVTNIKKDGTHFRCFASMSLLEHPTLGRVFVSVLTDITELKKARDELEQRVRDRTASLTEAAERLNREIRERKLVEKERESLAKFPSENPNPVLRVSKGGKILYTNEAGKLLLAKWKSRLGETAPAKWRTSIVEAFNAGKTKEADEHVGDKIFSLCLTPVKEAEYVNIYARNVSELRKAESEAQKHRDRLLHISRLSTVGAMASGLAHELNQPLCAILTHAHVCLRTSEHGIKDLAKLRENLETITLQSKLAGEIVNRIKDFVQKREPHRTTIDINDIICETVNFLNLRHEHMNIDIDLRLDFQIPNILADPIQIEQVLLNIMNNAIESMQQVDTRKHRLTLRTSFRPDTSVEVAVVDTGIGISEVADKLFEPFFTTKGDGLGIGLSISRSIIEAHGGIISAQANQDYGCTFKFTLPIEDDVTARQKRK